MQKMYQKNTMKVYHSHRKAMFSICEAGDMGEIFGINKETCGTSQLRQMGPRQTQVFWCFLHVWKWGTPRIPLETSARLRPWNACCWFEHSWNFKWPRMCGWNFWWMLGPARCFVWSYNRMSSNEKLGTTFSTWLPPDPGVILWLGAHLRTSLNSSCKIHIRYTQIQDDSRNTSKCYPSGWDPVRSPQQEILQLQKSSGTIPLINWMSAKEWCLTV